MTIIEPSGFRFAFKREKQGLGAAAEPAVFKQLLLSQGNINIQSYLCLFESLYSSVRGILHVLCTSGSLRRCNILNRMLGTRQPVASHQPDVRLNLMDILKP